MFVPKIPPRPKATFRKERSIPAFRSWIKRHICSVKGCGISPCDPAHIRAGLPSDAEKGGTSLKSHDRWIIPLCREHHDEQGSAEIKFGIKYQIDQIALSTVLWEEWLKTTQPGQKWRREHDGT